MNVRDKQKRWEVDPHPNGSSIHLEPWSAEAGDEGEQPSHWLDPELSTRADAEALARRLNEHAEMLVMLRHLRLQHHCFCPLGCWSECVEALALIEKVEAT